MWISENKEELFFAFPNGKMARITREEWEKAMKISGDCLQCRRRDDLMFDTPILGGRK